MAARAEAAYADRCRRSLSEEQATSRAKTDGWAHVDKDQVHADWDALYTEIASSLDGAQPGGDRAQDLVEKHFEIASRFYTPTREAYIGMAILYSEDAAMQGFHNAYHPRMVEFLGRAMRVFADRHLRAGPHRPISDAAGQGPVLQGARVRIEPISHERALALLAGRPEPGCAWEQGFPPPELLASLRRVVDEGAGPGAFGPCYAYVIFRRCDGLAVGDAGFFGAPGADGEVEIGYALVPGARGSGLAREAVALLAEWALAQPGVRALTARVEPDNTASLRLLDRLGFVADGRSKPYLRYLLLPGNRTAT